MMQVEEYIAKLLYNHDCVIVPGLGAFIANPVDAKYEAFQEKFFPPGKQITFNTQLNHNDGLLAGSISRWLDISYDDAIKNVRQWVVHLQKQLQGGSRVDLGAIGQFRLNDKKNLVFHPTHGANYLKSSYGLIPVSAIPIVRKEEVKEILDEEMVEKTIESPRSPRIIPLYAKVAAAAAVALIALWIPFQSNLEQLSFDYSSIDFTNAGPSHYAKMKYGPHKEPVKESQTLSLKEIDTSGVILWDFENSDFGPDEFTIPVLFSETMSTNVALKRTNQYHLIVGCFKEIRNAERLVKKLNKTGARAKIIGKRNGLNVVSYGAFGSREQAKQNLIWVQENVQRQAWVLKY